MTLSSGSILLGALCLYLYSQGSILFLTWLFITTIECFRALRIVRPNGRKMGIATRRKAVRQALTSWIVLCVVSQVEPLISAIIGWLPFYSPIKWVISIAFLAVRVPASTAIYSSAIRPILKRYEKPIDLILLLLHSIFQLFTHFTILLPLGRLQNAGQGVYTAVIEWRTRRTGAANGTAFSPITINDESPDDKADVDDTLPSDISLSTPNVPGRLVSSTRKRSAPARIRPISRAEIGEGSRTPRESQVAMPVRIVEEDNGDAARLSSGRMSTTPRNSFARMSARSHVPLELEQTDTLTCPRTPHSGQNRAQASKSAKMPPSIALEIEATSSSDEPSDRDVDRRAEPSNALKKPDDTIKGTAQRGGPLTALVKTTRPASTAFTLEAPVHPRAKSIYPPLPPPAPSRTATTTTQQISRKRPLPPDITDVTDEPIPPTGRTRRKLGPPVRVLLDPPKSTLTRQPTIASSRSTNLPSTASSTIKQAKEMPARLNFVRKEAIRSRVLSDKNPLSASDQQVTSKTGFTDRETTARKVGEKRQAMVSFENPTIKRVRKTV